MVVAVMMSRDMCTMALEVAAVIAATRITRNSIHVQQFPRKPERATLNTKLVIAFGHHPGRPRQRPANRPAAASGSLQSAVVLHSGLDPFRSRTLF